MAEAYVWSEGLIALWTGSATASAVVAYAQNLQAQLNYGMQSDAAASGRYRIHSTGRRGDVMIGAVYTYDNRLQRMADSARTDVHVKLLHANLNGSAGLLLWSGAIDAFVPQGSEASPFTFQLTYHAHVWSAFGGG